jgi:hypothetical protein
MDNNLCGAIQNRNIIEFIYDGKKRVVEPYCFGLNKSTGNKMLRAFQVGGFSSSGKSTDWKLYVVSKLQNLIVTEQIFEVNRSGYNPNDKDINPIYCCIR